MPRLNRRKRRVAKVNATNKTGHGLATRKKSILQVEAAILRLLKISQIRQLTRREKIRLYNLIKRVDIHYYGNLGGKAAKPKRKAWNVVQVEKVGEFDDYDADNPDHGNPDEFLLNELILKKKKKR